MILRSQAVVSFRARELVRKQHHQPATQNFPLLTVFQLMVMRTKLAATKVSSGLHFHRNRCLVIFLFLSNAHTHTHTHSHTNTHSLTLCLSFPSRSFSCFQHFLGSSNCLLFSQLIFFLMHSLTFSRFLCFFNSCHFVCLWTFNQILTHLFSIYHLRSHFLSICASRKLGLLKKSSHNGELQI